jgi:hypothetical protein
MGMNESERIRLHLWRLGLLMTGSERGASAALLGVLRVQEDLLKLSHERRLRLLTASARRWRPGAEGELPAGSDDPRSVLAGLEALPRVAWVLRDMEGMGEVEVARVLGLGREAAERYAGQARARITESLGTDAAGAVRALREAAEARDPAPAVAALGSSLRRARLRRRLVSAVQALILLGAMALIAWVGRDLLRANTREKEMRTLQERLSLPMSDEQVRERRARERRERSEP